MNREEKVSETQKEKDLLGERIEDILKHFPHSLEEGLTIVERQHYLPGVGRLDLLGRDKNGDLVVVEVKRGLTDDRAIGQIQAYMGAVAEEFKVKPTEVRGIIVCRKAAKRLVTASQVAPNISIVEWGDREPQLKKLRLFDKHDWVPPREQRWIYKVTELIADVIFNHNTEPSASLSSMTGIIKLTLDEIQAIIKEDLPETDFIDGYYVSQMQELLDSFPERRDGIIKALAKTISEFFPYETEWGFSYSKTKEGHKEKKRPSADEVMSWLAEGLSKYLKRSKEYFKEE